MKGQERVLVFSALILLAGVIFFNVLTSPSAQESDVLLCEASAEYETSTPQTGFTTAETTSEVQDKTKAQESKININTAGLSELMTLTGIGEVKARAILSYRTENGAFSSPEDLINVSGIGEKILAKIIDKICV